MRTMFFLIFWIFVACFFSSCEKELPEYEGPSEMYFFQTDVTRPDTSEYSFTDHPERGVDTMKICVNLLGAVKPYDRYYKVTMNEEKSTAKLNTHYEKLPDLFCLPAGKDEAVFGIVICNQKDLLKQAVFLVLEMRSTSDFSTKMRQVDYELDFGGWGKVCGCVHTLMFSDRYKKPASYIWSDEYFGKFSQEKLRLMLKVLNISYKEFTKLNYMTFGRITFISKEMHDYVTTEAENGNILKDEDGDLIVFNPY